MRPNILRAARASATPAGRRSSGSFVVGDASYVNSLTCNATGSYERVDTAYSRAFLDFWVNASR